MSAREMEEITRNFEVLAEEMRIISIAMTDAHERGETSITREGPMSEGAIHVLGQSPGISVSKVNDSCYTISWAQSVTDSGATGTPPGA